MFHPNKPKCAAPSVSSESRHEGTWRGAINEKVLRMPAGPMTDKAAPSFHRLAQKIYGGAARIISGRDYRRIFPKCCAKAGRIDLLQFNSIWQPSCATRNARFFSPRLNCCANVRLLNTLIAVGFSLSVGFEETTVITSDADRISRDLDDNEVAQRRSRIERDGLEIGLVELERLIAQGITLV